MTWVRFTRDFDYSPKERGGRVTIAYRAGMKLNVTRDCAAAAAAAGATDKAERTTRAKADEDTAPQEA